MTRCDEPVDAKPRDAMNIIICKERAGGHRGASPCPAAAACYRRGRSDSQINGRSGAERRGAAANSAIVWHRSRSASCSAAGDWSWPKRALSWPRGTHREPRRRRRRVMKYLSHGAAPSDRHAQSGYTCTDDTAMQSLLVSACWFFPVSFVSM